MKPSIALLHIYIDVIKRDIPAIESLCANWKQEYVSVVQPHLIRWLHANKYHLHADAKNPPVFEEDRLFDGKHTFTYHKPEVRVVCKKVGERMTVRCIKFEAKPEE